MGKQGSVRTEPHCPQIPAKHRFGKRWLQLVSESPQKASKDVKGTQRPGYWLGMSCYEVSFTNCKTSGKGNWAMPVLFATVEVNF